MQTCSGILALGLLLFVLVLTPLPAQGTLSKDTLRSKARQHDAQRFKIVARSESPPQQSLGQQTFSALQAIHHGHGTWFTPDVNYCGGTTSTSDDMVVAASAKLYEKWGGGTKSKLCGQKITLKFGGKSVNATISDQCPECAEGSIDMSPAVFRKLAKLDVGLLKDLQWFFVDETATLYED